MVVSIDRDKSVLVVSVILMTTALFARDLFGMGIGRAIFIVLAVVPALIMSYQSLVYFIFFLFSLTSGLPGNYIFPILIFILLYKNKNSFNRNGFNCFLVLVFMELIHYITYSFHISLPPIIGYFSDLFFLFYFITLKDDFVDIKRCIIYFCVGLAVFLFAIYYITQINGNVYMLLEESGRLGNTKKVSDLDKSVMMLNANPNGLGFFSLVGVASIIVLYFRQNVSFLVMLLLTTLFVFVGLLGVSRTYLFCLVAMVFMLLLFARRGRENTSFIRCALMIVFVAIAAYYFFLSSNLYDVYNARLTNESMETLNGRTVIFAAYNDFLVSHPIYFMFGTGAVYYGAVAHIGVAVHNGLQQILVSYGFIGFLFFVYLTIRAIKICYKKGSPIFLVPFIAVFVFKQSGQILCPSNNLYMFIVVFYIMKLSKYRG